MMIDSLVCAYRVVGWLGGGHGDSQWRPCGRVLHLLLMRTPADQREGQSRDFPAFFLFEDGGP